MGKYIETGFKQSFLARENIVVKIQGCSFHKQISSLLFLC